MIKIIIEIIIILAGLIDNIKYILLSKTMEEECSVQGISKSFLIISIVARVIILMYAIYIKNTAFIIVYAIGMIATLHCHNQYLKICKRNKNRKSISWEEILK